MYMKELALHRTFTTEVCYPGFDGHFNGWCLLEYYICRTPSMAPSSSSYPDLHEHFTFWLLGT
jgi:hypothetical protein